MNQLPSFRLLPAVLLAAWPALGQEPPPAHPPKPETPPRFEEVVDVEGQAPAVPDFGLTAAKLAIPLHATPASVGVVPSFLFQSQDGRILGDALRNVSGVNVATNAGVHDYYILRGFDSVSSGLVLTDGAAEPEATFYPLYNVRRVEVLKGPAAYIYGGNPLSGAVNLIRKQPAFRRFADLSGSFGSFGTYQGQVDLSLARPESKAAFRLNGLAQGSDSYRDGRDNRMVAVNPSLTWKMREDTALTLNLEHFQSDYKPDSGLPLLDNRLPDVPRETSYQSPFDRSEQDILRVRADFTTRLRPRLTLRNKLYYTDLDWRSEGTVLSGAFRFFPGAPPAVVRTMVRLDDRQKLLGDQLEATVSFETGRLSHRLLAGLELGRVTDTFALDVALLPLIALQNPVETARQPLLTLPGFSQAGDARSHVLAPYLLDRISFSSKVQLFLGGRFDVLDYEDDTAGTKRSDEKASPMLGLVFSPAAELSFYAHAAEAFAPPSSLVVGERKPEESRQLEAGVKKEFRGGKVTSTAAVYHLRKDQIAIPDATGVTRQTGDQRSRGAELEVAAEVGTGWFTFAAYAFNDAELKQYRETVLLPIPPGFAVLDHSGNAAPFAPRHIFNLWTMKEFNSGLGLGAGVRYVGRQFIAADNAFAARAALLFDAAVSLKKKRWVGRVSFKNLTDREYETRGFGSAAVIPGGPFAVYATLGVSLGP